MRPEPPSVVDVDDEDKSQDELGEDDQKSAQQPIETTADVEILKEEARNLRLNFNQLATNLELISKQVLD